jgi:membrane protein YdbS with pleckstrin-like domain
MFDAFRTRLLRVLRVPHDPDPPAGAPGSVRVFRAGRNFYKMRLARWGLGQIGALAGILVSLTFLEQLQQSVEEVRAEVTQPVAKSAAPTAEARSGSYSPGDNPAAARPKVQDKSRKDRSRITVRRIAERWPWWLFPLLTVVEWIGVLLYVIQIPITYAMARLDYELRWYIVTDRSLRIRAGLAAVQETTMSFANVQQVVVTQGPLQRLLGIADLRVQSAGGGGDHHERGGAESLHTGVFHGVENANEIRDLILDRLRAFRQAGLGDPEDSNARITDAAPSLKPTEEILLATSPALAAAHDVLQEARALRRIWRA